MSTSNFHAQHKRFIIDPDYRLTPLYYFRRIAAAPTILVTKSISLSTEVS